VGVGRSSDLADPKIIVKESKKMSDVNSVRSDAAKVERERVSAILELASRHNQREFGEQAIREGASLDSFRGALLDKVGSKPLSVSNDIGLNPELFSRIRAVKENPDRGLSGEEQRLLDLTYRRFVRNGALLSDEDQTRLRAVDEALGLASLGFGEKVLADLEGQSFPFVLPEEVAGIPADALAAAEQAARDAGQATGWLFTLHAPSYLAYLTYSEYRPGRELLWRAFAQRGFRGDANDTRQTVAELVRLRSQRAQLLGYPTHADFVLEELMATASIIGRA
jgi:peptidyl-dipeptidase Dcp